MVCTLCAGTYTRFDPWALRKQFSDHLQKKHHGLACPQVIIRPPLPFSTKRLCVWGEGKAGDSNADSDSEDSCTSVIVIPLVANSEEEENGTEDESSPRAESRTYKELKETQAAYEKFFKQQQQQLEKLSYRHTMQVSNASVYHRGVQDHPSQNQQSVVTFSRKESLDFFADMKGRLAVTNLVKKSIYQDSSDHKVIKPLDVAKFFLLVKSVWMMPTQTRKHLAPLLGLFQSDRNCHHCGAAQRSCTFLAEPVVRFNDLRKLVWEGQYAFIPRLPHPNPRLCKGDCIYIPVMESIAHLLHWDKPTNFDSIQKFHGQDVRELTQCKFAQSKFDWSVDFHFVMITWQDGFQANYSTKVNRIKPWIKTATLALHNPSDTELPSIWKTTFPVSFGLEKANRKPVEECFYRDMRELDKPGGLLFYHGGLRKPVKVRVTLLAVRGDQPERRNLCGTIGVNGNNGPAFGVIGNYKSIHQNIPSCDSCLRELLYKQRIADHCSKCLNWDVCRENSDLNLYHPSKSYPAEEIPEGGKLKCRKLTFEILQKASDRAIAAIFSGEWTQGETEAYLEAHALNKETYMQIIRFAQRCVMKREAEANKDRDPQHYKEVMEWYNEDPGRYNNWEPPAIWSSGLQLEQVPCIIMHLLFLGIVKYAMEFVISWLKTFTAAEAYARSAEGVLDAIQALDLPWCKALPYAKGSGGAWVSENYLALGKLLPWFYSMLDKVKPDVREEVENLVYDRENKKCWTSEQCKYWLEHRGLDSSGKADARQKRVHYYQTRKEGVPDRIKRGKVTPNKVMMVIQSLFAMLSRLMSKTTNEDSICEADCYTRIFLSYFSLFDKLMIANQPGRVPSWVSHANFLSLTRLIEGMSLFGPLRLFWEGGVDGEGILKYIKTNVKGGMRKNWHLNCMLKLLRTMTLAEMEHCSELEGYLQEIAPELPPKQKRRPGYHRYKTLTEADAALFRNKPFSGVLSKDGTYGFCVRSHDNSPDLVYVVSHLGFSSTINAMAYHKWELNHQQEPKSSVSTDIVRSVLFLPELCDNGFITDRMNRCIYTVIDDDWMVLDKELKFALPTVEPWFEEETDGGD